GPRADGAVALKGNLGTGVSLLQLNAPIAQIREHDGYPGDRTAHEIAGAQHLELAVQIAQLRLALEPEQLFEPVHAFEPSITPRDSFGRDGQKRTRGIAAAWLQRGCSIQVPLRLRQCPLRAAGAAHSLLQTPDVPACASPAP